MPKPINISASRGAVILGLSKWQTAVNIWLSMMEERKPGFCAKNNYELPIYEDTANFRWGKAFESAIIKLAENKSKQHIISREYVYETKFLTCHIDGKYLDQNILHEGKTTNIQYFRDNFGEPGTDQVPIEYQIQCQHQMFCTGAEKVILSVLVFPRRVDEWEAEGNRAEDIESVGDLRICFYKDGIFQYRFQPERWANVLSEMGYFHQYKILSHPELQKKMISAYNDFWHKNILGQTPPEIQSYDDIRALVREPVGTIIADENIMRLASEYKMIGSEISTTGPLAKRREQVKCEILKYMMQSGATLDDESTHKWILRGQDGKKLASYGKDKNGNLIFR